MFGNIALDGYNFAHYCYNSWLKLFVGKKVVKLRLLKLPNYYELCMYLSQIVMEFVQLKDWRHFLDNHLPVLRNYKLLVLLSILVLKLLLVLVLKKKKFENSCLFGQVVWIYLNCPFSCCLTNLPICSENRKLIF